MLSSSVEEITKTFCSPLTFFSTHFPLFFSFLFFLDKEAFCIMCSLLLSSSFISLRLSLKLEPQTPVTPISTIPAAICSPVTSKYASRPPMERTLRGSRSCEEGLNAEEGEDVKFEDKESPFEISQRNSYTRRSLNTNSKGSIHVATPSKQKGNSAVSQQHWFKSKHSVPLNLGSGNPKEEKFTNSVVDAKKVAISAGSPSSSPIPLFFKQRSSLDWVSDGSNNRKSEVKLESGAMPISGTNSSSLSNPSSTSTSGSSQPFPLQLLPLHSSSVSSSSSPSSSTSSHSSIQPLPPQKHSYGPPPSPLLAARMRGHKKSQSVGAK